MTRSMSTNDIKQTGTYGNSDVRITLYLNQLIVQNIIELFFDIQSDSNSIYILLS